MLNRRRLKRRLTFFYLGNSILVKLQNAPDAPLLRAPFLRKDFFHGKSKHAHCKKAFRMHGKKTQNFMRMPRSEIASEYPTLPLSVCKIIILRGFPIPFLCPIPKAARPPAIKKICAIIKFIGSRACIMKAHQRYLPLRLSCKIKEQKFSKRRKFLKRNQYAETKKMRLAPLTPKYC